MQPYFFPYVGYWQLMNAVDKYVLMDDVCFIKRGYINRNRILCNGAPVFFRIPVHKISQNKLICEHTIGLDEKEINKLLRLLYCSYKKAPNFDKTYNLIKEILEYGLTEEGRNLSTFLENANRKIAHALGITTSIYSASRDIKLDSSYKKEYRVLETCKRLGATEYYNAIGGTSLYNQSFFRENGMNLRFVKTDPGLRYQQFEDEFVPNLSIIDIMMFCSDKEISSLLGQFSLETGDEGQLENSENKLIPA